MSVLEGCGDHHEDLFRDYNLGIDTHGERNLLRSSRIRYKTKTSTSGVVTRTVFHLRVQTNRLAYVQTTYFRVLLLLVLKTAMPTVTSQSQYRHP